MMKRFPDTRRLRAARQYLIVKKFAQCIGIASLVLVTNYGQFLGGGSDARMHSPIALTQICLAQMTDILIVTLVLFGLLMGLRRTPWYRWARLVLAIVIPPYVIERSQSLFPAGRLEGWVTVMTVVWAAILLALLLRFPVWYRRTMRGASALCAFMALFAVSSIGQLVWVAGWKPAPHEKTAAWATAGQPRRQHKRVVWILFDELSYQQVYERRAKDLAMPNFDRLKAVSTVFTNVQPVGYKTVKIIPSLFTGRKVDDFHYSVKNRFWVHHKGDGLGAWDRITGQDTVFADAQRMGWRTGVVGWYNPYCPVYGDAIDECYWINWDRFDGPMSPSAGFWRNVYSPLGQMWREIRSPAKADHDLCTFDVRNRYKTHLDLMSHTVSMLTADQADFLYVHLGIPHSPNIWSRIDDNYTRFCDSSYLDNLALVDKVLGRLMGILVASPRWKDTTVIVQGDHSWRIDLWDGLPAWTDEDDAASRGVFDPRPALVIHQAGQTTGRLVTKEWPLIQVHDVLEELVKGQALKF